uniref:Uncharacterized protein n=1 Tax=Oryza barthii TaxID=65489 RepID=A0A0D3GGX7_9ORYZ
MSHQISECHTEPWGSSSDAALHRIDVTILTKEIFLLRITKMSYSDNDAEISYINGALYYVKYQRWRADPPRPASQWPGSLVDGKGSGSLVLPREAPAVASSDDSDEEAAGSGTAGPMRTLAGFVPPRPITMMMRRRQP